MLVTCYLLFVLRSSMLLQQNENEKNEMINPQTGDIGSLPMLRKRKPANFIDSIDVRKSRWTSRLFDCSQQLFAFVHCSP